MDNKSTQKYLTKANDSFKTKLNLYLFSKVIQNNWNNLSLKDFTRFEINQDLIELYTTEYWQYEPEYEIKPGLTNDAIYKQIDKIKSENKPLIDTLNKDYIGIQFPVKFPKNEFKELLNYQECAYCHITIADINQMANNKQLRKKNYRGWSLEVDRLDSNKEYSKDNCVMACYWCNNAKTDEFTEDEFKKIGKEIRKIWETRSGKKLGNIL